MPFTPQLVTNRRVLWMVLLTITASLVTNQSSAQSPVADEQVDAESEPKEWWREARFGMFIHWGLYSAAGGEWQGKRNSSIASWIAHEFRIPSEEYEKELMPQFTAEKFDPDQWARLAKTAGMKYMVVTAKHHEGFCLYDSELTDYDSVHSAAGRDVIRPILEAFRKQDIHVGLYYSLIDWHHPGYPVLGDPLHPMRENEAVRSQPRDFDGYVDYLHGQVDELMTNYGPIDILWWDYSYGRMSGETWRGSELIEKVRARQPKILMNNRLVALDGSYVANDDKFGGDFQTPEQFVPPQGIPGLDWETCMTINTTWGYKPYDHDFKSSRQLIHTLIETASRGGNLLLNVGPRPDGTIPEQLVERLEAMGAWLNVNGEAIYGTTASPYKRLPSWGRVTTGKQQGGITPVYLHVFDWPADQKLQVPALESPVKRAYLLADVSKEPLEVHSDKTGLWVKLPAEPLDDSATVVVLEVEGKPIAAPFRVRPGEGGRLVLQAIDADLHGEKIRCEAGDHNTASIGWWTEAEDWASWPLQLAEPGAYQVKVTYGCDANQGGTFTVAVGDEQLQATAKPTGGWFQRSTESVGTLALPAGVSTLSIKIEPPRDIAVLDLVGIELVRVVETESTQAAAEWTNPLQKQGYVNSPLVEVTPFVFRNKLYLLECWRSDWSWPGQPSDSAGSGREMWIAELPAGPEQYEQRKYLSRALPCHTLGSAMVWDDRVYVFAVSPHHAEGRKEVFMTSSEDLLTWSEPVKVFDSPQGRIFNVAVTRDDAGMVFLWETDGYGKPFTMCYGRVDSPEDNWNSGIVQGARYGEHKYTGGPALYFHDGWYYTLYLEQLPNGWETHITRSRDLKHWDDAPQDRPVVAFDPHRRGLPLRPENIAENNASDLELCYFQGKTIAYFTGSDQQVAGDLQWASYSGTPQQLLESYFRDSPDASSGSSNSSRN
ncbi:alpha-L-fucosidase [Aeoliella mucimassa]|uniref:alpha-L-fucosidase n=1 Tax=Aeoliella mucimassa TaxID=2527972 RepID=UPI0018D4AF4C|nr:alpha-L-fucosidase [Aeoliella mucimassa]